MGRAAESWKIVERNLPPIVVPVFNYFIFQLLQYHMLMQNFIQINLSWIAWVNLLALATVGLSVVGGHGQLHLQGFHH